MAFARVQATPMGLTLTGADVTLTFPVSPSGGNLIVVPCSVSGGGPSNLTASDNQGNTYHVAAQSVGSNGCFAKIFYAYNVAANGGPFTITLHRIGPSGQNAVGCAIEFFGTSTTDPLVGSGINIGLGPNPSGSTASLGTPEAIVVGVLGTFRLNFDVSSIVVQSVSPAWTQEYERLSFAPFTIAGEGDSRIVANGNAQSIAWTMNTGINWAVAIAAFYSSTPPAALRLTQLSRDLLEQQSTTTLRLTQFAREVVYPFTCTPGPSPTPSTGCPEGLPTAPVTGRPGHVPNF